MKRIIALIAAALFATAAWAACSTHTIIGPNGGILICSTCCYGNGNCTTTCY